MYVYSNNTKGAFCYVIKNIIHEFMQTAYVLNRTAVAYPGFFFGGGVQQNKLRTEGILKGALGAVAP
jgi:hypothetical protein